MADKISPDQVLDAVGEWSLLEVNDFVKKFEEKFDVSAAAAPVAMMVGPAGGGEAAVEEQTEFTVTITDSGSAKIKVIKEVRALNPELGLKEAKELVDNLPTAVVKDVSKEDAERAQKQLEAAGAIVEVK